MRKLHLQVLFLILILIPSLANAADFSDEFDGSVLDPAWVAESGSFSVSGGSLREGSGTRFIDARLRWTGGTTLSPAQYAKLQVVQSNTHSWGFILRDGDSSLHHYEVHLPPGTSEWRWELYDSGFVERVSQCTGDFAIANGDWIGAMITGVGSATEVEVFRWDTDPDAGGSADPGANWGVPDCTMGGVGAIAVDDGLGLGIRAYTGSSSAAGLADAWAAGDVFSGVCGNSVLEAGEQCDEGGATATCDADCTLPVCGDGTFNPAAEQCELDGDCSVGEICTSGCACVAAPICGNGIPEPGEACDTGGASATCDADCTAPMCGDGVTNPLAGEQCEVDAECAFGERCQACGCAVVNGQIFFDDFEGAALSLDWTIDSGFFSVGGGNLIESSGQSFLDAQLRWEGGQTDTPDQFAKLELATAGTHTFGFMFREGDTSLHHYEIHLPIGTADWRWELYDPDYVERVGDCFGDAAVNNGDWIGATVVGSGASTLVSVFRWDSDPDAGGVANPSQNWGVADCTMTGVGSIAVDDGRGVGIRSYTGVSGNPGSITEWTAGDLLSGVCGNSIVEVGEDCDDGGESASCDANCTFAICGDGVFNPLAESCEMDADCAVGEICLGDCTCVPQPVCGNGFVEPPEACDDAGESATCDTDCTFAVCGDGLTNPSAGETCELDSECAVGERCQACGCVVVSGQVFSNSFDGPLGSDWVIDSGNFSVVGGALIENSGQRYIDAQLRFVGGLTDTVDQFGKLQVLSPASHTWGFMLRVGDSSGHHYEIHAPSGGTEWRWELNNPGFVERVSDCVGDAPVGAGNWIGAAVQDTGAGTAVFVWRWNTDPDTGGLPDVTANWGTPDCAMVGSPSVPADDGRGLGIRSYTGSQTSSSTADNWAAGDLVDRLDPPGGNSITLVLDSSGAGTPNSMIDPDGLVADSQDNVYVASCALNQNIEGVFKIEPDGTVTQILDSNGDGTNPGACYVGIGVDSSDNVYAAGFLTDNVFKITPAGVVTQIFDSSGDGVNSLSGALGLAVDGNDNVYVGGHYTDNAFKITPGGAITQVLDASGDGATPLDAPFGLAADAAGSVYVAGFGATSDSVFKVDAGGAISTILGPAGDGVSPLTAPHALAVDAAGTVYVTGNMSDNVFAVTSAGAISEIATLAGDGLGNTMDNPTSIAVDGVGNVYVNAFGSENAFKIEPGGTTTKIIDLNGDGTNAFRRPADFGICVDSNGTVFTAGTAADNVFKIEFP